jgi:hypothetical protein
MRLWIIGGALALAGCAEGDIAGYNPRVSTGGLPVTRAVARQDVVTPPGRRDLLVPVRTFAVEPDGGRAEVEGVCKITAGSFTVAMATPGRLSIPDLGPDAPAIRADCTAAGLAGAAIAPPVFSWPSQGGNAAQRAIWGLGWTYGYQKQGPMSYPALQVDLTQRVVDLRIQ